MGEIINAYKIVVEKGEGKRLLGTCRHSWEEKRLNLREREGRV
jgi:hypothetical protein